MSQFISTSQVIQLAAEQGSHFRQKVLSLGIAVVTCSLRAASGLGAGNVVTILIIDINSIEVLVRDDVDKCSRQLVFASETIIPAIIWITYDKKMADLVPIRSRINQSCRDISISDEQRRTRPTATHSSSSKTQNHFLATASPAINQILTIHVLADGNLARDLTQLTTLILGRGPSV